MCAACNSTPCDSRCPNADQPEVAYICIKCKGDIYVGDKYFQHRKGKICEECMDSTPAKQIVEMCGEEYQTA